MVQKENNLLTISMLCEIAHVSRSGYYNWVNSKNMRIKKENKDKKNFEIILQAYQYRGYDKGARGIYMRLIHMDPPIIMNVKKIRRLMKKYNLFCPIRKANPYRRMAKALKTNNIADNILNREFKKYGPRMVLLTDITYICYSNTKCYLSVILDAFTKEVLSYVLSISLEVDFVLDTVNILIEKHGISLSTETLVHSDQGYHYTSYSFIQILKDKQLRQSMSRKGNCWDNAPQESFFGHMKDEIDLTKCNNFDEVKIIIDDWINYYNTERYQWELAKLSPDEYYEYIVTGEYPLCALPAKMDTKKLQKTK